MYVDSSSIHNNGKTYTRHLLRESYRDRGKVKHRTIANISSCSREEIQAIKLALKHKGDLSELVAVRKDLKLHQGPSFGSVWLLYSLAKELKISKTLGQSRQGWLCTR